MNLCNWPHIPAAKREGTLDRLSGYWPDLIELSKLNRTIEQGTLTCHATQDNLELKSLSLPLTDVLVCQGFCSVGRLQISCNCLRFYVHAVISVIVDIKVSTVITEKVTKNSLMAGAYSAIK